MFCSTLSQQVPAAVLFFFNYYNQPIKFSKVYRQCFYLVFFK
uniref:Uncharacterized protein n=1 Tax=Arundo donax TaxID=35708 RepID=A0A0A9FVB2_ARUDO